MCQIDNWLQFAYVTNLLVRKHNYIKERIAKGESIEYISVRNPMVWAERNVSSQRNFCYRVITVLFRNTSLFFLRIRFLLCLLALSVEKARILYEIYRRVFTFVFHFSA
jgi:hypothetical protein